MQQALLALEIGMSDIALSVMANSTLTGEGVRGKSDFETCFYFPYTIERLNDE